MKGLLTYSFLSLWLTLFVCPNTSYTFQNPTGDIKKKEKSAPKKGEDKPPAGVPKRVPAPPGVPTADLTIKSSPVGGCTVLIDGKKRGTTSAEGYLTLTRLKQGRYSIIVRKIGYADATRTIYLTAGMKEEASFDLSAKPVPLSVNVNVPGARIEVSGIGSLTDRANRLTPGRYTISVSKPGFRTEVREIEVHAGKPESISVTLSPILPGEMIAQAEGDYGNRRYAQVIAVCLDLLKTQPEHPKVNLLLGQSYYKSGQYGEGVDPLAKAVALGEQVTISIKHHKGVRFMGESLCPAEITLHKGIIKFSGNCGDNFSVPFKKLKVLKPEAHKGGRLHIEVAIPRGGKDGVKEYNFHVTRSDIRKNANGVPELSCDNCNQEVEALYQLLEKLRQ